MQFKIEVKQGNFFDSATLEVFKDEKGYWFRLTDKIFDLVFEDLEDTEALDFCVMMIQLFCKVYDKIYDILRGRKNA